MGRKRSDEDSDYSAKQFYRQQRMRRVKPQTKKPQEKFQKNKGKWTSTQRRRYVQFLQQRQNQINDENYRKEVKVFKLMSLYVATRTADQCRSHHQKILKIHGCLSNIMKVYEKRGILKPLSHQIKDEGTVEAIIYDNLDKQTCFVSSVQYFTYQIKHNKFSIIIDETHIQNY